MHHADLLTFESTATMGRTQLLVAVGSQINDIGGEEEKDPWKVLGNWSIPRKARGGLGKRSPSRGRLAYSTFLKQSPH